MNQGPHRPPLTMRASVHAIVIAAVFLTGYAADVGRGFIKEDATWILRSRLEGPSDLTHLLTDTGGFFRPVVALSFAANYWMFGNRPAGYGWTNLLLAAAVALSIFRLASVLALPRGAALLATSLWLLSFHGINMAVIWLSGRTALLLVLFATLAATEAARHRLLTTCLFALLAVLSKEEGVFLPVILVAVLWFGPKGRPERRQLVAFILSLSVVIVVYGVLRASSDAETPSTAPAFYRFTAAPEVLGKNLVEYADRALTLSVVVALIAVVIGGVRPILDRHERNLVMLGGAWVGLAFALTMFLPVRSSLYALFPSVGATIACASVLSAAWRRMTPSRQSALTVVALLAPLTFVPVYWSRNHRWSDLADVSRELTSAFSELSSTALPDWRVVVIDDRQNRTNLASALEWSLPDAVELTTGKRPHVWLIPAPPDSAATDIVMAPAAPAAVLALRDNRIVRIAAEEWRPALAGEMH